MRAVRDACGCDHLLHPPPGRHAAPRPEQGRCRPAPLCHADAVHQVEHVEQFGGHRHRAKHPRASLLQALEHDHPAGQVDLPRGQGEGLGNPASGGMQHAAEGAHLARRPGGGGHEGAAFILGEIQPPPVGVEQLHTGVTGPPLGGAIDTFHRNSVSRQPRQGQRNGDKPPQSAVGRADRGQFLIQY